jgi:hypothetical protein
VRLARRSRPGSVLMQGGTVYSSSISDAGSVVGLLCALGGASVISPPTATAPTVTAVIARAVTARPRRIGSHHCVLTEVSGRRWFVAADAVAESAERLADLTAVLTTRSGNGSCPRCGREAAMCGMSR